MRPPAIVHLIGFPAAGKLTIARSLALRSAADGDRFVVLDNHHTNNVIFAAIDVDGVKPVPPAVWDRVDEVRAALLRTIELHSPSHWSFVFTNVLTDDDPDDRALLERLAALAARTGRAYLPVILQCDVGALGARVANRDRRDRSKWIDPAAVIQYAETHRLLDIPELDPLLIDSTAIEPDEAAVLILQRLDSGV